MYQHGLPPQAMYVFKHALIQEAAYQSLVGRRGSTTTSALPRFWQHSFPRRPRRRPSYWPITTRRRGWQRRPCPTGCELASALSDARPTLRQSVTSRKGWRCSRHYQNTPERTQQELVTASSPGRATGDD